MPINPDELRQPELGAKIDRCIEDYARDYGAPHRIILNDALFAVLGAANLREKRIYTKRGMLRIEVGDFGENLRGTEIELRYLPEEVAKIAAKMQVPLVLCRRGWFKEFKRIACYELAVSSGTLAQALAY